jgi:hypothetical protein
MTSSKLPDMAAATFNLTFNGYWREPNIGGIPAESGVYAVYICTFNEVDKTVLLHNMIYIGEAADAKGRVASHERWSDWLAYKTNPLHQLCFSFAPVPAPVRVRVEAALINRHKPPANNEYTLVFPFDATTIILTGRCELLTPHFTVLPQS